MCHCTRGGRLTSSGNISALTPTQIAGYSDEQLLQVITQGEKLGTFSSDLLQRQMPDCVYRAIHSYELSDEEKRGIVWKLRSLPPRAR